MNAGMFILIIIIGGSDYRSGYTSVVQEFNSKAACEMAREWIVKQVMADDKQGYRPVLSSGCHPKSKG